MSESAACSLLNPPINLTQDLDIDLASLDPELIEQAHALAIAMVTAFILRLGTWIHGGGSGKPQGVMIRAYIAFWDVLPWLRDKKQTQLAELIGVAHKQSVGREVSDFRTRFCWRNGHMQSDQARAVCRERERLKREEPS